MGFRESRRWIAALWRGGDASAQPGHVRSTLLLALPAAVWFGLCTCAYLLAVRRPEYYRQVVASAVKVPLLLWLVLLASAAVALLLRPLIAPRMGALAVWRISCASAAVTAFALVPLGTVLALAAITKNYSIVVLCCYACFIAAGLVGAGFATVAMARSAKGAGQEIGSADARRRATLAILWAVAFGVIAADLGWSMRPFVGWTGQPFTWLRHDGQHYLYKQVYWEIWNLRHGGGAAFP